MRLALQRFVLVKYRFWHLLLRYDFGLARLFLFFGSIKGIALEIHLFVPMHLASGINRLVLRLSCFIQLNGLGKGYLNLRFSHCTITSFVLFPFQRLKGIRLCCF